MTHHARRGLHIGMHHGHHGAPRHASERLREHPPRAAGVMALMGATLAATAIGPELADMAGQEAGDGWSTRSLGSWPAAPPVPDRGLDQVSGGSSPTGPSTGTSELDAFSSGPSGQPRPAPTALPEQVRRPVPPPAGPFPLTGPSPAPTLAAPSPMPPPAPLPAPLTTPTDDGMIRQSVSPSPTPEAKPGGDLPEWAPAVGARERWPAP